MVITRPRRAVLTLQTVVVVIEAILNLKFQDFKSFWKISNSLDGFAQNHFEMLSVLATQDRRGRAVPTN